MTKQNVLLVNLGGTGNEPDALRGVLEAFGCRVLKIDVGRPSDFIEVLAGEVAFPFDCLIISCHGEDGKIIMPVLGEEIYAPDEPRGNFGAVELAKYLRARSKIVISTGCTTGNDDVARVFTDNYNTYLAPTDYIDGNAVIAFVTNLFYAGSYEIASRMRLDCEDGWFGLYRRSGKEEGVQI